MPRRKITGNESGARRGNQRKETEEGRIGLLAEAAEKLAPAEWVETHLGLTPDPVQATLLNSGATRVALNCTRQWGKSTVTAAKAIHQAARRGGSLTLVVSPSARQSGEFMRKAADFTRRLGFKARGDGDNEMSLLLPNRSRIVGLPGSESTIRGFSAVSLLLVDEASRVEDDLYLAIRPMLATSSGTLWLMSTPFGKRGFFYRTWDGGGASWQRVKVTAEQCPRIPKEHLKEEKRTMGDRWFRQEYMCEFVDNVSGVFNPEDISKAVRDNLTPLKIAK
jgi:hypothetical protein